MYDLDIDDVFDIPIEVFPGLVSYNPRSEHMFLDSSQALRHMVKCLEDLSMSPEPSLAEPHTATLTLQSPHQTDS